MSEKRLAKASYFYGNNQPSIVPGLAPIGQDGVRPLQYLESVRLCRQFYRRDGIANTVVNRMAEIASTQIRNRRKSRNGEGSLTDEEFEVYNAVAQLVQPHIETIMLSYLIDGMAIPQYELTKLMGSRVNSKLGRRRYALPHKVWCRNPENIILKSTFNGGSKKAYIRIPKEDISFIQNKGVYVSGERDTMAYQELLETFPEYVKAILAGQTVFPFNDYIIFRKLLPHNDYPIPFLEAALDPLDHKRYLKMMDKSIASRAIESFRHFKIGDDLFPADDDDIIDAESKINQNSTVERVYNLVTNHTWDISWVIPPLEALLADGKYVEANADIFFALGFPRILTVGETEKSNAADNKIASLGVLSTLKSMQDDILKWLYILYNEIADVNGFSRVASPYFTAIPLADLTQLIQYASIFVEQKAISRDVVASFYGSDMETEHDQMVYEEELLGDMMPKPAAPKAPVGNSAPQEETEDENTTQEPDV